LQFSNQTKGPQNSAIDAVGQFIQDVDYAMYCIQGGISLLITHVRGRLLRRGRAAGAVQGSLTGEADEVAVAGFVFGEDDGVLYVEKTRA
jgi:hypothetical protein